MNEQKPNYLIVLYNFLIFAGYMALVFKIGIITLYLWIIHLLVLLIVSIIFSMQGHRAQAGIYFLSFWVIVLIAYPSCVLLFSLT